jgi:hypothetical protein
MKIMVGIYHVTEIGLIFKKNREGTVCKAYKNVINFMKFYNLNVCYSFTLPSSSEQTR